MFSDRHSILLPAIVPKTKEQHGIMAMTEIITNATRYNMVYRRKQNFIVRSFAAPKRIGSMNSNDVRKRFTVGIAFLLLLTSTIHCKINSRHRNDLTSAWRKAPFSQIIIDNQRDNAKPLILGKSLAFLKKSTRQIDISRLSVRGGATSDDESDDDEDQSDDDSSYDDEDDIEDEEDDDSTEIEISSNGVVANYDEPLAPSPFINLYASIGVMILARKFDLFHPIMVKIARFGFILYLIMLQIFLFYVRIQARMRNDRTPLEISSPITSMIQSQLGGDSGGMIKNLASSLLSSKSTFIEYDLKQSMNMQSGLIFNMLFMWFLHFKMEQVQPLLIQTITGLSNMIYSPLFQVYVMGRNLERPFKTPVSSKAPEDADVDDDESTVEENTEAQITSESSNNDVEIVADDNDEDEIPEEEDEE
jgi:Phosphate transport (Pho88)